MVRFFIAVFILLSLLGSDLKAQELLPANGSVVVVQDEKLDQLSGQYRKMSQNNQEIDGYRVQIFFDSGSNSKNKAISIKGEFDLGNPEIKSYLSYKEPYYRVRVGNFRTLSEAVGFQKKLSTSYPNSFAVKDKIIL
ncbi:MAG: SPOR domain-containing protein [Bacteroidales bacterium]